MHVSQEWSEAQLRKIVREEVSKYVNERKRAMLAEIGLLQLEGKVEYRTSNGLKEAYVDYSNVVDFLQRVAKDGQKVRIVLQYV